MQLSFITYIALSSRFFLQVNAALQQLQIRGSSLGSNILKIEVEDLPSVFTYDVRLDEFWNPKTLFRTETDMSLEQAQLACKYELLLFRASFVCFETSNIDFVLARARLCGGADVMAFNFFPPARTFKRLRSRILCLPSAAPS